MEPSGCSCSADFDPIEMYSHIERCARADRTCDECGAVIRKGSLYHVHQGRCDGYWIYVRNCAACEQIRGDYGCGAIGGLDEVVYEALGVHINGDS